MAYNAKQLLDALTIDTPVSHSILIVGRHATGKSQIVFQAGDFLKCPVVDFRASQNDVGDMKGMPFFAGGRTLFAPPEWFPLTEESATQIKKLLNLTEEVSLGKYGSVGILFLDEINRGSKEMRQCCFQLVNDRELNGRSLPDGWRVVAAVNPEDDAYDVNGMDVAFISRFKVIEYEPTPEDFFNHAPKMNLHGAVYGFLRKNEQYLDPTTQEMADARAKGIAKLHDRRSWDRFSQAIHLWEGQYKEGTRKVKVFEKTPTQIAWIQAQASSYVGTVAAAAFRRYVESDYNVLTGDQVLNHWSPEVGEHIKKVLETPEGVNEIGAVNNMIRDTLRNQNSISKDQSENLYKYLCAIPNEPCASFWKKWCEEQYQLSTEWYDLKDEHGNRIMVALEKPKLTKTTKK